ncbi:hypothetical protein BON22_1113 [Cyberlindnera fabianii]|uniref:Phosphoinositide phospholipase C n=1 Tax=Cyberlindnera fabianii TaxID=36022 RepID=A0A1V2LBE8_CYBFA|nr:hypothetical protein BON22_1113 [Cyberlindnera fabianii]
MSSNDTSKSIYGSLGSAQSLRPSGEPLSSPLARQRSQDAGIATPSSTEAQLHTRRLSNNSSPRLVPMKNAISRNVSSLVQKLPSPSTSPIQDGIRSLLRKTNIGIFQDHSSTALPTDGPLTKSFDELTRSPLILNNQSEEALIIDSLNLNDNQSQQQEVFLESPKIPEVLIKGLPLLRITRKKKVQRIFKIDLDKALVTWNNKATSKMSLDNIQKIRIADDAKNYREEYGVSKEHSDRWATILYTDMVSKKLKALHIIAPTQQDFELFIGTLTKLVNNRRELMKYLSVPGENFAHIHWKNYISKQNRSKEALLFEDVLKLTQRLHINCDEQVIHDIFTRSDSSGAGALSFADFQIFVKALKVRPEIVEIFQTLSNDEDHITTDQFSKFVTQIQKQNEDTQTISSLYTKFSPNGLMDIEGFTNYLSSTYSTAIKSATEDLTHPLNEYFISSSHNTYLLGRQYGGSTTSVEGYTRALQRGCRSVEIDIWDGDNGPVVTHGPITSSISLRDVLETINKYSFIVTPLPLFLSLEIHCKAEYQIMVRDLLIDVFGDMLLTKPLWPYSFSLPSPLELKHKVLVKVKQSGSTDSSISSSSTSASSSMSSTAPDDTTDEEIWKIKKSSKKGEKNPKLTPELAALGVYASGLKFTNFSLPESKTVNHIFSFSDHKFNSMIKQSEKEYLLKKHNRHYLMRVYPSNYRYKSSNFLPITPWFYGVQMVATNWQTYDLGQQINEAMFHAGSKSGYVLKPPQLRDQDPQIKFKHIQEHTSYIKFSIDIISGQLLPRPRELKPDEKLDPYVVFELIDPVMITPLTITDLSTNRQTTAFCGSYSTKNIPMNGFNPLWNTRIEGTIKDLKTLNFARFLVKTGDTPFAVHCCKLDTLNQGYRHIPLYDLQGEEYIFSTLFVKVNYDVVDKI